MPSATLASWMRERPVKSLKGSVILVVAVTALNLGFLLLTATTIRGERIDSPRRKIDPRVCNGCSQQASALATAEGDLNAAEAAYDAAYNDYVACLMGY